jgi:hypothetical protein
MVTPCFAVMCHKAKELHHELRFAMSEFLFIEVPKPYVLFQFVDVPSARTTLPARPAHVSATE